MSIDVEALYRACLPEFREAGPGGPDDYSREGRARELAERLYARLVPAEDEGRLREALHRGVDVPLADDALHPNVRRSRVHAAIDVALAATPEQKGRGRV